MAGRGASNSSLPAVLGAVAAVITAVAAAAGLFWGSGGNSGPEPVGGPDRTSPTATTTMAQWVAQTNQICALGYEEIRALGLSPDDPQAQMQAIPAISAITVRVNQQIAALDRPPEAQREIQQLIELASRGETALYSAYQAWLAGDLAGALTKLREAQGLDESVRRLDSRLGANVCARGP